MSPLRLSRCRWSLLLAGVWLAGPAAAEPDAPDTAPTAAATSSTTIDAAAVEPPEAAPPPRLPAPKSAQAMPGPDQVWVNAQKGIVLVDGYVSLNEGLLEMFACPSGTKEHESIVAVYSRAQIVHAALLAAGAEVGHPVQWDPKFEPPTGTEIDIEVRWLDEAGQWQTCPAQQWLYDLNTEKPMAQNWVFAGSGFWKDEETGKEYYLAEAGDLICVSNFSSATLDVPVESSQLNGGLLYEANTKNIPEIGTPVRLVLKPKLEKRVKGEKKPHSAKP